MRSRQSVHSAIEDTVIILVTICGNVPQGVGVDRKLRNLERLAKSGDPQALAQWGRAQCRMKGHVRWIVREVSITIDYEKIGRVIYAKLGPNTTEIQTFIPNHQILKYGLKDAIIPVLITMSNQLAHCKRCEERIPFQQYFYESIVAKLAQW